MLEDNATESQGPAGLKSTLQSHNQVTVGGRGRAGSSNTGLRSAFKVLKIRDLRRTHLGQPNLRSVTVQLMGSHIALLMSPLWQGGHQLKRPAFSMCSDLKKSQRRALKMLKLH